jgi:hypothetical protein
VIYARCVFYQIYDRFNEGEQVMAIAKGNTRLPVTLNEKRKQGLKHLNTKYKKSESKLMCIVLDMLLEQEKAGFEIPALRK